MGVKMSKKVQRIIIGVLLMVIIVTIPFKPLVIYAGTTKESKKIEISLEKQYGISINLSSQLSKNEDKTLSELRLLRDALHMMPKGLIKTLVKHFKSKGKTTTIVLSITSETRYGTPAATYDYTTNTINLYIPKGSSMWGSGTDPNSIIHEFGHMVQNALDNIYGSKKLKSEFMNFNEKKAYGSEWKDGYELVFVREYATTDFREDFAETFMASIESYKRIQDIYSESNDAPLVKKSEYIQKIIESKLKVNIPQEAWMIYPQAPSKKYVGTIESAVSEGIYYNDTGTYQYKIKKATFYKELRDIWIESKLHSRGWDKSIAQDDWKDYIKLQDSAQIEYGEFVNENETNIDGKIKRKDVALILADVMDHANILDESNENLIFNDCGDLTNKYKKNIQKVVNAGLMVTTKSDKFSPESYCTYEQAFYALIKLYDLLIK